MKALTLISIMMLTISISNKALAEETRDIASGPVVVEEMISTEIMSEEVLMTSHELVKHEDMVWILL